MRTGAGMGLDGYVHDFGLADSDAALIDLVAPFLHEGTEAGEPAIAVLSRPTTELLAPHVPERDAVQLLSVDTMAKRPATALMNFRRILAEYVAAGVEQVRVVHEVPHSGPTAQWDEWSRYEAAVNVLLADVPVWGRCLYDSRSTSAAVLDDVARTHPLTTTTHGVTLPSARYEDPISFLAGRTSPTPDPVECTVPRLYLVDPTPADARKAVGDLATSASLPRDCVTAIVTATNEVVTNARLHGQMPVEVRGWVDGDRVVVTVTDRGDGPTNPFAGLAPTDKPEGIGGFGLWIAHQLVSVVHRRGDDRFAVQLATRPPAA